jgi:hypothetical protein
MITAATAKGSLVKAYQDGLEAGFAPAPSEIEQQEKIANEKRAVNQSVDPRVQLLDAFVARMLGDRDSAPKNPQLNKDERAVTGTQPGADKKAQAEGPEAKAKEVESKVNKTGMYVREEKKASTVKTTDIRKAASENISQITKAQKKMTAEMKPAADKKAAQGPTLGGVVAGTAKGAAIGAAVAAFMPAVAPVVSAVGAGVTLATIMGQGTNGASTPSQPVASGKNSKNDKGVIAQSAEPVNMAAGANNFPSGGGVQQTDTQRMLAQGPGFGRSPSDIFDKPDLGRIGLVSDALGETKIRNQDPKAHEASFAGLEKMKQQSLVADNAAASIQKKGVSLTDGSLNPVVINEIMKGRVKPGQNLNGMVA